MPKKLLSNGVRIKIKLSMELILISQTILQVILIDLTTSFKYFSSLRNQDKIVSKFNLNQKSHSSLESAATLP